MTATSRLFQHTAARRRLGMPISLIPPAGLFQHTAARRRLDGFSEYSLNNERFQHTAARRRLGLTCLDSVNKQGFQHTAARRRLVIATLQRLSALIVSTHSRPKAAGRAGQAVGRPAKCFNTQPPEGGWPCKPSWFKRFFVSTHSRPKAAGTTYPVA